MRTLAWFLNAASVSVAAAVFAADAPLWETALGVAALITFVRTSIYLARRDH